MAMIAALKAGPLSGPLTFFLPHSLLFRTACRLSKHSLLHLSRSLTNLLSTYLTTDCHQVDVRHYKQNGNLGWAWKHLEGLHVEVQPGSPIPLTVHVEVCPQPSSSPPSSPLSPIITPFANPTLTHSAQAYLSWHEEYDCTPHHSTSHRSCAPPQDNKPPPFVRGVLEAKNRQLFSTSLQLSTGHAFEANYSYCFQPQAPNNTTCHCSPPDPPFTLFTINHVLRHCPLYTTQCNLAFGCHTTLDFIFGTREGGKNLRQFLRTSQVFLHPLPPHPDPL